MTDIKRSEWWTMRNGETGVVMGYQWGRTMEEALDNHYRERGFANRINAAADGLRSGWEALAVAEPYDGGDAVLDAALS